MDRHLWLVGMMGSGKSVVGPLVAYRLESRFVDTDAVVVSRVGVAIDELWNTAGEAAFREEEVAAVAAVAAGPPAVVATGGGVVLDRRNVAAMQSCGAVVWLRATPATLDLRVGSGLGRPLLANEVPLERLEAILEERITAYEAAADLTIDTDDVPVERVAAEIEAWWNKS